MGAMIIFSAAEEACGVVAGRVVRARPHRGLNLAVPQPVPAPAPAPTTGPVQHIERVDVLGGLIHEYQHAA
jgi:hypothetical protein